ncbi:DNA replication protein DnaD, partial [Bacillus cereus]|nr:DNA replication protein DnaD [Bacillus cereus]
KQWVNKNIRTLADVNAAEIEFKNKGKKGAKRNGNTNEKAGRIPGIEGELPF